MYTEHVPVLANEVVEYLIKRPSGVYIDGTAGSGGHSRYILHKLAPDGLLIMLDVDEDAIAFLKQQFSHEPRAEIIHASYAEIPHIVNDMKLSSVDGVLLDLGVSTHQVYEGSRGFSFMREGPLDMRFSKDISPISAYDVVNSYDRDKLVNIFTAYGEEPYADEIADAIIHYRKAKPIETTLELADIVADIVPYKDKKHPATRVFQALRIYVNNEFDNIEKGIRGAISVLNSGGRLGVITYHSLEDKLVKRIFSELKHQGLGRVVKKNGIRPKWSEIQNNRKARSAIMRIFEKR
ncbi:16S rRNA (cytosine(1402)-N(4))-methyltransferase RsmH [Zhurongbacter thermophilus]